MTSRILDGGVPEEQQKRAHTYRMRAEELSVIASTMRHRQARESLQRQAREWERMAERAETLWPNGGSAKANQ